MLRRIAHITDTHLDDPTLPEGEGDYPLKNLEAVLEAIAAAGIDEIVHTGDLGEKETYPYLFQLLRNYNNSVKVIPGNHDKPTEVMTHFTNPATAGRAELYYAYEDEHYKYIFMDSSSEIISEPQLEWLMAEAATLRRIILFIHHPILAVNTGIDSLYPLHNRDTVNEILQQCKNTVTVFCGHYHMPDQRTEGRIKQYVTPAVSFQVKKHSPTIEIRTDSFAFRIITISESEVKTSLMTNHYDGFISKV